MYDLLTGPIFIFSATVCILGLIARIIWYIRGLDWQIDRVAYTQYPWEGIKGALRSIVHWIIPYASSNWRRKPFFTLIFFVFHIGICRIPHLGNSACHRMIFKRLSTQPSKQQNLTDGLC